MKKAHKSASLKRKKIKKRLFQGISDLFDLPEELLINVPQVRISGCEYVFVDNHQGIVEYTMGRVRLRTACGVLLVEGCGLELRQMGGERLTIHGDIKGIQYCGGN